MRCRPLNPKEKDFSEFEIVKILDKKVVILIDPYEYNGHSEISGIDRVSSNMRLITHLIKVQGKIN